MSDFGIIDGGREAGFGDYLRLLKPRVMSLVVFTALVGLSGGAGAGASLSRLHRDPVHRPWWRRLGGAEHVV